MYKNEVTLTAIDNTDTAKKYITVASDGGQNVHLVNSIPAGANTIGNVTINASSNTIGNVNLTGTVSYAASGKTAVTGTFTAAGTTAVFSPAAGRRFSFSLSGAGYVGTIQLERSIDSGTTWLPLTVNGVMVFSATYATATTLYISEMVLDDLNGVQYRLVAVTGFTGTAVYRITQ